MKMAILPGHEYDVVSPAELEAHYKKVDQKLEQYFAQAVRGIKPIRFSARAVVANATGAVLAASNGPRSGYVWAVVVVTVQTSGASGLASMYFGRATNPNELTLPTAAVLDPPENHQFIISAFDGGVQTQRFSKEQALLNAGEIPLITGLNSGGAPVPVTMVGTAIEVPAEMVGKLIT